MAINNDFNWDSETKNEVKKLNPLNLDKDGNKIEEKVSPHKTEAEIENDKKKHIERLKEETEDVLSVDDPEQEAKAKAKHEAEEEIYPDEAEMKNGMG